MVNVDRGGVVLAVLLSIGPIAVLAHGLLNAGSIFTGLLMIGATAALYLLGEWRSFSFGVCDAAFALLVFCIVLSFGVHGIGPDRKEFYLLILSLAAYPAARAIPGGLLSRGFILTTGAIVAAGTGATAVALAAQWTHPHGKPFVFGYFDAAPAQFTFVMGFLVIALACFATTAKRALIISSVIALPAVIFATSMVRFAFVAILAGLTVCALVAPRKERKFVVIIICVIVSCVAAGNLARSGTSAIFLYYAGVVSTPPGTDALGPYTKQPAELAPASQWQCKGIDQSDSIAIRKHLYSEAFSALVVAGLSGNGFDSFIRQSCTGASVHNSVLQTAIEFGWIAGAVFLALVTLSWVLMWGAAKSDAEARFILAGLTFVMAMSMVHGRISQDGPLFLFLGYAVARLSAERKVEVEKQPVAGQCLVTK